ncbi:MULTISPECIES: type VI secretion system tube protein TssD [unclassified Chryseobacterium]|uniref:type VI secretion system tube protein TssD n=1 Tax=unclassified Chryseobacterium TaxID=2593645 RepID=UPI00226ACE21|nr:MULTISPECIES: type VI secretion system tube protein TssD [unclassified Chryseobacterium]
MSFLSKLELDGKIYNIIECKYNFKQSIDGTGKPQGMPQGGEIFLRIESTGNPELLGWMLDHSQTKDGKITFFRRDAMSKLQELSFEKAYCIDFTETFHAYNEDPLQIEMHLIARKFDVNGAIHEKSWK